MNIKLREEEILRSMRKVNPDTVLDGVVDENQFCNARYRIVYILKEVNGGKSWDLRELIYKGERIRTWDNIARWTVGILNWEKEINWNELKGEDKDNCESRRHKELKK